MSVKKKSQQEAVEQQVAARRKSAAHRSLRKRAAKRSGEGIPADAVVPTETATPAPGTTAAEPVEVDDAPTDTVIFARVPEFLRQSEDAVAPSDDNSDDPSTAALDPQADDDLHTVADPQLDPEPGVAGEEEPVTSQETTTVMEPIAEQTLVAIAPVTHDSDAASTAIMAIPAYGALAGSEAADSSAHGPQEPSVTTTPKKRGKRGALIALLIVLFLGGAYAAAAFFFAARVAPTAEVMGVDIGGLTAEEATAKLDAETAAVQQQPITLTANGEETSLIPVDAGLTIDAAATIDSVTGFTLNPVDLYKRITGSADAEPVVVVDEDALASAMNSVAASLDRKPVNASVTIVSTEATAVPGAPSVVLKHDPTAATVASQWPAVTEFEAIVDVTNASVSDAVAQETATTLNDEVMASAVTLTGPNGDAVIEPTDFAPFLSVTPSRTQLKIVADGAAVSAFLLDRDPDLVNEAIDASFEFDTSRKLSTDEGEPGRALDDSLMGAALVDAATAIDRTGPLAYREVVQTVTAEQLGVNDFKEVVSSFSTPLTSEVIRTKNLVRGAEKVTGVVIKPGKNFDLTDALTPITVEDGFFSAHVIVDGILTNGIGGGLSQMSTTTYNAGYFAGYEDIAHRPHSKYFTRYPAGREATIYTGQINMVFKNNTPYASVMSSYVKNNRLYVEIWSTPYFTVKTEASPRTNVIEPTTEKLDRDDCEPSSGGQAGFTITNKRTVFLDDVEVDKTSNTWTYKPDNEIVCI